jgi:hypothetical protein
MGNLMDWYNRMKGAKMVFSKHVNADIVSV